MALTEEQLKQRATTYGVFIDLLGYGSIILDKKKDYVQKTIMLTAIYSNIATAVKFAIGDSKLAGVSTLRAWSFSDSVYLECDNAVALLHVCNQIFRDSFSYYANVPDEIHYTPLLRGGMARGWSNRLIDISAFVNDTTGDNPVGEAIATAYGVGEKSRISGMRMILIDTIIKDLESFPGYKQIDTTNSLIEYHVHGIPKYLYFRKINRNEVGCSKMKEHCLYELLWPVDSFGSCTFETVEVLKGIKPDFDERVIRHYKKTAGVLYHAIQHIDCTNGNPKGLSKAKAELKIESKVSLKDKIKFAFQHIIKAIK